MYRTYDTSIHSEIFIPIREKKLKKSSSSIIF